MKSIALKKFRNLVSTGSIDLKPITLLVGANGSGKSSFLRFFPLIRQSVASRVAGSILWYSEDFVDFGSFRETINCHDTRQSMSFSFDFGLDIDETYFPSVYPVYLHGVRTRVSHDTIFFNPSFAKLICHVNFVFDENRRRESIESIELEIADNKIVIGSNLQAFTSMVKIS